MTEEEWLACNHPAAMLIYLRGEVSDQERSESKGRLHSGAGVIFDGPSPYLPAIRVTRFVTACAARLGPLPLDENLRRWLDLFQRYANGYATLDEARAIDPALRLALGEGGVVGALVGEFLLGDWDTPYGAGSLCWRSADAIALTVAKDSIAITCAEATEEDWSAWAFSGGPPDPLYQTTRRNEERAQSDLLREVIGNPFRPASIDPTWLAANDRAVVKIAQEIDEEDAFERMPILADALLDAGCPDEQILGHCRSRTPHVRGCWLLDSLLGTSELAAGRAAANMKNTGERQNHLS
jgi:hypothetical protein